MLLLTNSELGLVIIRSANGFEIILRLEHQPDLFALVFGVDYVYLIVEKLAEDFVAHLRAFQSAGHSSPDVKPEHVHLPFDPVPGEGDRTTHLVLEFKIPSQVSHHQITDPSV